jgi:hypothetical protein
MSVQEAATNTGVGTGTAGTALAVADRNLNANFKAPTSGTDSTGQSAYFIDNATEQTTSTLNLRVIRLTDHPGNVLGDYANYICAWNAHVNGRPGTTGV